MARVEKISIALPVEMIAIVKSAVDSGEYSSASEVIRDALRSWKFKRKVEELEIEDLKQLAQEGINSGSGIDSEIVFAKLKARYAKHDKE